MARIVVIRPLILGTILAFLSGCSPGWRASFVTKQWMVGVTEIPSPTKVFLIDSSVILFTNGFRVQDGAVVGTGRRYSLTAVGPVSGTWWVPLDSVAAATYYPDIDPSPGRQVAGGMLALFGTAATSVAIYCAACPKCCFGSCPTVYTLDGANYTFETELFSYSVSRLMQEEDLDVLAGRPDDQGSYVVRVTNEAMETHCIDRFSLLEVRHPPGTRILPTPTGSLIAVSDVVPPDRATNRIGVDLLPLLSRQDRQSYRSGVGMQDRRAGEIPADWIDLTLAAPRGDTKAALVLLFRNTLLSTVLFYDVVLASQGIEAVSWTERLNTDLPYGRAFSSLYRALSGIHVEMEAEGEWKEIALIRDPGPIGWKEVAVEIPSREGTEIRLRLRFFPDNFMIDRAGFDLSLAGTDGISLAPVAPVRVVDNEGVSRPEIPALLQSEDERFLVTNPGESYRFFYQIPPSPGHETTLAIASAGYYTEWVRGDWLRAPRGDRGFDLLDIDHTLDALASAWRSSRDEVEEEFLHSRIPVREKP